MDLILKQTDLFADRSGCLPNRACRGRTIFQQKDDHLKQALARRKVYRASFSELSALMDRDLKVLGIPRSNIKRISMEAAYDR